MFRSPDARRFRSGRAPCEVLGEREMCGDTPVTTAFAPLRSPAHGLPAAPLAECPQEKKSGKFEARTRNISEGVVLNGLKNYAAKAYEKKETLAVQVGEQ